MKAKFRLHFERWSLLPTICVRTRLNSIVIEWLCVSLWLDNTFYYRTWSSNHISVSFRHIPTHISLLSLQVDFREKSVDFSILGFYLSVYLYIGEDADLPF